MNKNSIQIPWKAHFGDQKLEIQFLKSWELDVFSLTSRSPIPEHEYSVAAQNLVNQIKNVTPETVAIAIDDLTRPLSYDLFFKQFLNLVASIEHPPQIFIIVGLGTHHPLTPLELRKKIGNEAFVFDFVHVMNHDYKNDVVSIGLEWGNTPIKINRFFFQADFKVIMSTVIPHPFAGFSGGAKMVIPGLSNIEITKKTHQIALMGLGGRVGDVNNKFRKYINDFIQEISIDYFIGFLSNDRRECVAIEGGELNHAYNKLTREAKKYYSITIPDKKYDIIWLNAYPKDTELLQIDTALIPTFTKEKKYWDDNSIFVISAACSKGLGHHDLFGPGGVLYRTPRKKRHLSNNKIFFLLPSILNQEFVKVYWEGYKLFHSVQSILNELEKNLAKNDIKVALFTSASLQIAI